jgi:hypothetical protein
VAAAAAISAVTLPRRHSAVRLHAGVAVDAFLGIDVELLGRFEVRLTGRRVDAVDRADLDADAGLVAMQGSLTT